MPLSMSQEKLMFTTSSQLEYANRAGVTVCTCTTQNLFIQCPAHQRLPTVTNCSAAVAYTTQCLYSPVSWDCIQEQHTYTLHTILMYIMNAYMESSFAHVLGLTQCFGTPLGECTYLLNSCLHCYSTSRMLALQECCQTPLDDSPGECWCGTTFASRTSQVTQSPL